MPLQQMLCSMTFNYRQDRSNGYIHEESADHRMPKDWEQVVAWETVQSFILLHYATVDQGVSAGGMRIIRNRFR